MQINPILYFGTVAVEVGLIALLAYATRVSRKQSAIIETQHKLIILQAEAIASARIALVAATSLACQKAIALFDNDAPRIVH